jgi:hypothetical protein
MVVVILTADQVLHQGLICVGFKTNRIQNTSRASNLERFRAHYGSNPLVYAQIWEDLQTARIPEAYIEATEQGFKEFMMSVYFLKCYPTEAQLSATFNICEKTVRKWCWFFARKIQALKRYKVCDTFITIRSCLLDDY